MKPSLRLPSPVPLALAPGRAARKRSTQIGSRGPSSSLAYDGPEESARRRHHRRHGKIAANHHPSSSPSRRPAQIPGAIAPRSSERSDSMTASDRRSAGWLGLQGEALVENLPSALDGDEDGDRRDDDADDAALAAADEEARFLDQAAIRGRGSLVKGILSLVKEGDPVRQLEISEAYWRAQKKSRKSKKNKKRSGNSVVERHGPGRLLSDALSGASSSAASHLGDFDVVVAGGTLGLLLAAALQGRPCSSLPMTTTESSSSGSSPSPCPPPRCSTLRCAVVERGPRVGGGRVQEWNCSRSELEPLVELGVLSREELDSVVVTECGPMSVSFLGGGEEKEAFSPPAPPLLTLSGVLDVGVCPVRLMALLRRRFEERGGVVLESREFVGAEVFDDGVLVKTRRPLTFAAAASRGSSLGQERSMPLSSCPPPPAPSSSSSSSESSFEGGEEKMEGEEETGGGGEGETSRRSEKRTTTTTATLSASLLVDCMGHWSPLVKAARAGQDKPDAVCLVVGACVRLKKGGGDGGDGGRRKAHHRSFSLPRLGGEFLASRSHASARGPDRDVQWLWEQFPAAGGEARTLYQFAYVDAGEERPSLESSLGRFFADLPEALGGGGAAAAAGASSSSSPGGDTKNSKNRIPLCALELDRVLFGAFPSYARAPLLPSHDRVLHAGDAAGGASPLSFGGFGAMLRHLPRLASGVPEALEASRLSAVAAAAMAGSASASAASAVAAASSNKPLSKGALCALTPYSPSLSTTWLFASAMRLPAGSVVESRGGDAEGGDKEEEEKMGRRRPGAFLPGDHVSALLSANFRVLSLLGPWALGPFVSERVRFLPLAATMLLMGAAAPRSVLRVLRQVGPLALARWAFHAMALAAFALLRVAAAPLRGFVSAERRRRRQEVVASSAAATANASSSSSRTKLLLRALAARAFAALGRLVDALEYGSGHDGSEGGGGGSHGVRIVSA